MLEINNIMLGRNNNKLNIIIKYMKKDKLRLILMTMATGLVAATIALYAYQVVSKGEITIGGSIAFLIPFLIIFFMIFFIVSRYKDVKAGMPLEDERSKKVMNRAAAMSFYVTLYWLILFLIVSLTFIYADRRNLYARHQECLEGWEDVRQMHLECEQIQRDIDATRQRVERLRDDPVEIEAVIRSSKDYVCDVETVFRIQKSQDAAP